MAQNASEAETDGEGTDAGTLRRAWQSIRAAVEWVADTFRGHSGAYQFEDRER